MYPCHYQACAVLATACRQACATGCLLHCADSSAVQSTRKAGTERMVGIYCFVEADRQVWFARHAAASIAMRAYHGRPNPTATSAALPVAGKATAVTRMQALVVSRRTWCGADLTVTSCPACATVRLPELSLRDRRLQPAIGLQPPPTRAAWVTHTTVARFHPALTRLQATELWSEASQRHAAAATGVCCLNRQNA